MTADIILTTIGGKFSDAISRLRQPLTSDVMGVNKGVVTRILAISQPFSTPVNCRYAVFTKPNLSGSLKCEQALSDKID